MTSLLKLALLMAIVLVGAAWGSDSSDTTTTTTTTAPATTTTTTTEPATNTIVDVARGASSLSTLVAALEAAGLIDTLQGDGPFTVFAPTKDAFAKIPEDVLAGLLADTEVIGRILLYHVLDGEVLATDIAELESVATLQGSDIAITVEDGTVTLNGASLVISTDVMADNGVIHVIDTAISPPQR